MRINIENIKQLLIKFACIYLCIFIASSCSDEITKMISTSVTDEDVLKARTWYESNRTDSISLNLALRKANRKGNSTSIITKPIWQNAYKTTDTTETAVHVPLKMQGDFGFVSP